MHSGIATTSLVAPARYVAYQLTFSDILHNSRLPYKRLVAQQHSYRVLVQLATQLARHL